MALTSSPGLRRTIGHAAFFGEVLEAAWSTLDCHKLRLLTRVLADGFRNDAPRLDIDREPIRAFRELKSPHLRVLDEAAQAIEGGRLRSVLS